MTRRTSFPMLAPVLALALVTAAGCGAHKTADPPASAATAMLAPSDVAAVTRTDLTAGIPVSGTLTPSINVKIGAPIGEVIDAVVVREGQVVRRGQVLARFRDAALGPAAAGADAELKAASAEYERAQNLFKAGAMSQRDVETAEARYKSAQATRARASKEYSDAVVRAPVAGVIAEKVVEAGNRPAIGDPMFRLVNTRRLEFEATVPSEYVRAVRPGAAVRLDISGFPAGALTGTVARVNAAADVATRQVKVYVTVPNSDGALVGGLYAQGMIVTGASRAAIAVPEAAVRTRSDSTFVYTVEQGRLAIRPVRTGVHDTDRGLVEILSGIEPGVTVVTGAIEGLVPGQPISVGGANDASDGATRAKGH